MSAHTPGPWRAEYDGAVWVLRTDGISANSYAFAELRGLDVPTAHIGDRAANAKLCAAAPELLAAAQRIVKQFDDDCVTAGDIADLEDAIRKAGAL